MTFLNWLRTEVFEGYDHNMTANKWEATLRRYSARLVKICPSIAGLKLYYMRGHVSWNRGLNFMAKSHRAVLLHYLLDAVATSQSPHTSDARAPWVVDLTGEPEETFEHRMVSMETAVGNVRPEPPRPLMAQHNAINEEEEHQ